MAEARTAEQQELARTVKALLDRSVPALTDRDEPDSRRAAADALWAQLVEMGITGIDIPEDRGGMGGSIVELGIVAREMGRALAPVSLVATMGVAAPILLAAADSSSAAAVALEGLLAGERIAVALAPATGWTPASTPTWELTIAGDDPDGDGPDGTATGVLPGVIDADGATHLLVIPTDDPPVLVDLTDTSNNTTEARTDMAMAHDVARLRLAAAPAQVLAIDGRSVRRAVAGGRFLLANEMLGANEAVLAMAAEHVTERHQFGQALGSFQAVAHRLARAFIEQRAAAAAVSYAERLHSTDTFGPAAVIAGGTGAAALVLSSEEALQVVGALGYTWEYPLHHFVKYARTAERLLGSPGSHLAEAVDLAGRVPAVVVP